MQETVLWKRLLQGELYFPAIPYLTFQELRCGKTCLITQACCIKFYYVFKFPFILFAAVCVVEFPVLLFASGPDFSIFTNCALFLFLFIQPFPIPSLTISGSKQLKPLFSVFKLFIFSCQHVTFYLCSLMKLLGEQDLNPHKPGEE